MKKICLIFFILTTSLFVITQTTKASNTLGVPYKTYTIGTNEGLVPTQTSYLPVGVLNYDYELNKPEDMYYKGDYLYIANTGANNIVVMDLDGNLIRFIGEEILDSPTGIFVDDEEMIYVADKGNAKVYKFNFEGVLLQEFEKPTEPLYGENQGYRPEKIVVDKRGNLYITGDGATNGVIQLNYKGNFLGYFGVNQSGFDWRMKFNDLFLGLTNQLAKNLPPAPKNVAIDKKGLIYTITSNINPSIKKFNLSSVNILNEDIYQPGDKLIDLYIDDYLNIYLITEEARIYQYDSYGNLLFVFGGLDTGNKRLGLIKKPTSLTVDDEGNIYVLDSSYNNIQIFQKTNFVNLIHQANQLYLDGDYKQSEQVWQEVNRMNNSFALANSALGKINMKNEQYDEALERFEIANDKDGYSDAFWEIRNNWLQNNGGILIISIVITVLLWNVTKYLLKRFNYVEKIKKVGLKIFHIKIVRELSLMFQIFKHPADTYYEIKREKKASYLSASVLYVILFIEIIASYYITSFIFVNVNTNDIVLIYELAKVFGLFLLWILANYLISTLNDGEGWFKDIYISSIYAFAPLIVGIIPLSIISNVLTYNEIFLFNFSHFILYSWSLILIFIMIKEIHNYKVGETIKNILLTIFTMVIIALMLFIVYLLLNQLSDFIYSLFKEVVIRVKNTL